MTSRYLSLPVIPVYMFTKNWIKTYDMHHYKEQPQYWILNDKYIRIYKAIDIFFSGQWP